MKYEDFGLDKTKKSEDKGRLGKYCCLFPNLPPDHNGFYGHSVKHGFSFCFAHFVICFDCVKASLLDKNKHRWGNDDCFKCGNKNVWCLHQTDELDIGAICICKECIEWADEVLTKQSLPKEEIKVSHNNQILLFLNGKA